MKTATTTASLSLILLASLCNAQSVSSRMFQSNNSNFAYQFNNTSPLAILDAANRLSGQNLEISKSDFQDIRSRAGAVTATIRSRSKSEATRELLATIGLERVGNTVVGKKPAEAEGQLDSVSQLMSQGRLEGHVPVEMFQMPFSMALSHFRMLGIGIDVENLNADLADDLFSARMPRFDNMAWMPMAPEMPDWEMPGMEMGMDMSPSGFRPIPFRTQGRSIRETLKKLSSAFGYEYSEDDGKVSLKRP